MKRGGLLVLAVALLFIYNGAQPNIIQFRTMYFGPDRNPTKVRELRKERYGPSLEWLDRVMRASNDDPLNDTGRPHLDMRVFSSLMVAGLASGFKSQVANLLWMKSDEYWHKGLLTRQNPLMEMVVTLDPQFIEAWSTAGWHWAYNIYADIPMSENYKNIKPAAKREKVIRQKQKQAIDTGLDYLGRGANMNPETYRLWFEWGWTRAEKAGYYDDETVELFKIARTKTDARTVEKDKVVGGKTITVKEQGKLDVVGHTIAHIYEKQPQIDKALNMWGADLLKGTPEELAGLRDVGVFWRRYGSDYSVIAQLYQSGDEIVKNRIKALVPDVDRLVAAQKVREKMQARASTPTGAYVTIAARYLPIWQLKKQGKYKQAVDRLIGVMNADPRYHLTQLPVLAKVLELRGDAPAAIQAEMQNQRQIEMSSSQDIGLHFLARLYEDLEKQSKNPKEKLAYRHLAYDSWIRSRERDQLDFYALYNSRLYEDKYGFKPSQKIIDEIKKSRKSGNVKAAPEAPPNVQEYYQPHSVHANAGGQHSSV